MLNKSFHPLDYNKISTKDEINKAAFEYNTSVSSILNRICEPLFANSNIKNFRYMRMFNDYTYFSLGTNLEYVKKYLQTIKEPGKVFEPAKIYSTSLLTSKEKKFCYFLWPDKFSIEEKDPLCNLVYSFDIWNGFTISRKSTDYVETWSFTTTKDAVGMQQFYINNIQILEYFIKYFESKAADVLKDITPDKLAVFIAPFDLNVSLRIEEDKTKNFFKESHLVKVFIQAQNKNISLSHRELECLLYTSMGQSQKQIASTLDLSVRTIESYLNSIKDKANVRYKSELISLISIEELFFLKGMLEAQSMSNK